MAISMIIASLPYSTLDFLFFAIYIALKIMAVLIILLNYLHLLYKSQKLDVDKDFCEPMGNYLFSRNIQKLNFF